MGKFTDDFFVYVFCPVLLNDGEAGIVSRDCLAAAPSSVLEDPSEERSGFIFVADEREDLVADVRFSVLFFVLGEGGFFFYRAASSTPPSYLR